MPIVSAMSNIESEATAIQDRIRAARRRTDFYIGILKDEADQTALNHSGWAGAGGEMPPCSDQTEH